MKKSDRRNRVYLFKPAEYIIYTAVQEIEKMPPSPTLTEALNLLHQAKEKVSDFIDEQTEDEQWFDDDYEKCHCGVPLLIHSPTSCGWKNASMMVLPGETTIAPQTEGQLIERWIRWTQHKQ